MISTHYTPPFNLPMISLTIKDAKLIALDWHHDKTARLFVKLNQQAIFIRPEELSPDGLTWDDGQNNNQAIAIKVMSQLDEYFIGKRREFDIPLDLSYGTPFQQMVWHGLLDIAYGHTISYAKLAKNIGKPKAFRACANANGKNPISIIVPCHRVIASSGGLGGYTGGTHIKTILLDLESQS